MEIKKIYFAVFITMLVTGSFSPLFGFNKNIVQALPQCHDEADNELPLGDGFTDFFGMGPPDPQCTCFVDDDENFFGAAGKKYYIAYDQSFTPGVDVHITFSCGMGGFIPQPCSGFNGDVDVICPTGWICSMTDTSADCYVGPQATQANACIAYDKVADPTLAVCTTPYEACGCTCCVTIGNGCTADSECCSGNCDTTVVPNVCIAAFVCAPAGGACTADADCCGGLVCDGLVCADTPIICTANDEPCTKNIDCCSGICDIFGGTNKCIATSGGAPVCTRGGLIPCGRNCDDPNTTGWNESDPCTLCHLVLMGQLIIEFLVKMAAIFAILALVGGGLVYVFSIGSAGTIEKAKGMIKYALLGFVVIFIAWAVITSILTMMGYMDPLGGDWHMMDC